MGESYQAYLTTFRPASASHSSGVWSTAHPGPTGGAVPARFRTPATRSGLARICLDPPPPASASGRGGVMYRVSSVLCPNCALYEFLRDQLCREVWHELNVDDIPLVVGERDAGAGPDARSGERVEEATVPRSASRPGSKGHAAMARREHDTRGNDPMPPRARACRRRPPPPPNRDPAAARSAFRTRALLHSEPRC